jgi:hypothetical protein
LQHAKQQASICNKKRHARLPRITARKPAVKN